MRVESSSVGQDNHVELVGCLYAQCFVLFLIPSTEFGLVNDIDVFVPCFQFDQLYVRVISLLRNVVIMNMVESNRTYFENKLRFRTVMTHGSNIKGPSSEPGNTTRFLSISILPEVKGC